MKKYAVTVFFHSGYKKFRANQLGPGLKGGSQDMQGDFTIVDCRTLVGDGRQHCRLLSLNCSEEFLNWLATKTKNHRYPAYHSSVYINGGRRSDSTTDYNAPKLTSEATNNLLKSNNKQIMLHSGTRFGFGKEIAEQNRSNYLKPNKINATLFKRTLFSPTLGRQKPSTSKTSDRMSYRLNFMESTQEKLFKRNEQRVLFRHKINKRMYNVFNLVYIKIKGHKGHISNTTLPQIQLSVGLTQFKIAQLSRQLNANKFRGWNSHSSSMVVQTNHSSLGHPTSTLSHLGRYDLPSIHSRLFRKNSILEPDMGSHCAYLVWFKNVRIAIYYISCLLYTSPSPRDRQKSRMPSSA